MSIRVVVASMILPFATIVICGAFCFSLIDQLPDSLAIRWRFDGQPVGFAEVGPFLLGYFALTVVLLVIHVIIAAKYRTRIQRRLAIALPNGLAWFMMGLLAMMLSVQLEGHVSNLPQWSILGAIGLGLLGGGLAVFIAGSAPKLSSSLSAFSPPAQRFPLPDDYTVVWVGYTPTSTVLLVTASLVALEMAILGLVMGWVWGVIIIHVVIIILMVSMASYRLTIGPNGVIIASWVLSYPRIKLDLDDVCLAESGEVDALTFLGWGIRTFGQETALVTKSGPALVLTQRDGRILRVSLEEPDVPVKVLATLLDRKVL